MLQHFDQTNFLRLIEMALLISASRYPMLVLLSPCHSVFSFYDCLTILSIIFVFLIPLFLPLPLPPRLSFLMSIFLTILSLYHFLFFLTVLSLSLSLSYIAP